LVELLSGSAAGRHAAALHAVVEAERSMLTAHPNADIWLDAGDAWQTLGRPFEAAEAQLHAAECLLGEHRRPGSRAAADRALHAAQAAAIRLGARPLLEQVEQLGRLARIRLPSQNDRHERPPIEAGPGQRLTEREYQVLTLLTQGKTNREIGAALYMSAKTASVHVTHILEKLGVQTRVQAAAIAACRDLDPSGADPPS
jgi:DNA-binding CsgD family transcriptional regulator